MTSASGQIIYNARDKNTRINPIRPPKCLYRGVTVVRLNSIVTVVFNLTGTCRQLPKDRCQEWPNAGEALRAADPQAFLFALWKLASYRSPPDHSPGVQGYVFTADTDDCPGRQGLQTLLYGLCLSSVYSLTWKIFSQEQLYWAHPQTKVLH